MTPCAALFLAVLLTGCGETGELLATATEKMEQLDYRGALTVLAQAEEEGENIRLVERSRGIAYMGLTEYASAIEAFKKSLAESNGFVQDFDYDVNYYLAAAYTKNAMYEEAEATYNAILALRPGEEDAYFLRGNVRMNLGNYDGAIEDFDKTLQMNPKNYDRLIEIYEVLANFGYREVGQERLQNALDTNSDKMDNYVIGRIYYYLGEYQKACLALDEAREKGGMKTYLYLGRAYEATGDYNYAASVYQTYLSNMSKSDKSEGSAEVYNQLGLCRMKMRQYREALEAFQAGMQTEQSAMLQTLSFNEIVAYENLGDFETAKALMNNYLSKYPDDEVAKRENTFLSTR